MQGGATVQKAHAVAWERTIPRGWQATNQKLVKIDITTTSATPVLANELSAKQSNRSQTKTSNSKNVLTFFPR